MRGCIFSTGFFNIKIEQSINTQCVNAIVNPVFVCVYEGTFVYV